jgi:hypothetical protein
MFAIYERFILKYIRNKGLTSNNSNNKITELKIGKGLK